MEITKKNWTRNFIPPCIANGEVDLVGYVKLTPPSVPEVLALSDQLVADEKENKKPGVAESSAKSFEWAKKFVSEVKITDPESGMVAESMDDLNDCSVFYLPLRDIIKALSTGAYGKKSLTKTA